MKCIVFTIRLQEGYTGSDEAALNRFLQSIIVKQTFASTVDNSWSILIFYEDVQAGAKNLATHDDQNLYDTPLTPQEQMSYESLRRWRNDQAGKEGVAAYMIANNRQLKLMAKLPVKTKDDLSKIKGFGEKRIQKYGDGILSVLNGPMAESQEA
jgi:superfamily II DNA helicase RecQ